MQIDWSLKLVGMAVVGILITMVITLGAGTVDNDKMYFVGETGIITAVIVVVIAVGVYKKVLYEGIVTYKEYKKIKKPEQ